MDKNKKYLMQQYQQSQEDFHDVDVYDDYDDDDDDNGNPVHAAAAAEIDVSEIPLPVLLPDPVPPASLHGIPLEDIYEIIKGMRRHLDEEEESIKANLLEDPNILLAVVQVLHESGLMKRQVVDAQGVVRLEDQPLPSCPPPPLPAGIYSWLPAQAAQASFNTSAVAPTGNRMQQPSYGGDGAGYSNQY